MPCSKTKRRTTRWAFLPAVAAAAAAVPLGLVVPAGMQISALGAMVIALLVIEARLRPAVGDPEAATSRIPDLASD
jgi:hypothetical protein